MAEGKEKKKKQAGAPAEVQRVQNAPVGEILRRARMEKGIDLEKVAAGVNIRVAQLRAIEEGNIEALPGMTYALGFVRSYANFLKLDSAEIVQKFKTEHGAVGPLRTEMHFPEPIQENRLPPPVVLGIAGFGAVALLVLWAVFSGDDAAKTAEQIPSAPVIETRLAPEVPASTTISAAIPDVSSPSAASAPIDKKNMATSSETPSVAGTGIQPPQEELPAAVSSISSQEVSSAEESDAVPDNAAPETKTDIESQKTIVIPPAKPEAKTAPSSSPKTEDAGIIEIKRGKGRIVLVSKQPSWVEVVDSSQKSLYKKVMRPGDQYYVPDGKGMSLITANAGGIDIYVDGAKVQSIGKPGEIVRGLVLDPVELKKIKIRTRD